MPKSNVYEYTIGGVKKSFHITHQQSRWFDPLPSTSDGKLVRFQLPNKEVIVPIDRFNKIMEQGHVSVHDLFWSELIEGTEEMKKGSCPTWLRNKKWEELGESFLKHYLNIEPIQFI